MFVFLGVHFNAFGVLEHVMSAGSVCIAETQSLNCVLFTFCIMSLNFHWSKIGMICAPAVMYSVGKPDISGTAKSEPVYALLAIISSEHTQQRILKKLAHCRVLFIAVRMFTRHILDDQPFVFNCECSSQTASTNDGFQPISSCPLPFVG